MDTSVQFKTTLIKTEPSQTHFLEEAYIQEQIRQLIEQREEVLRAFIAKYGVD